MRNLTPGVAGSIKGPEADGREDTHIASGGRWQMAEGQVRGVWGDGQSPERFQETRKTKSKQLYGQF